MASMQMARNTPTRLAIDGGEPLRRTPFAHGLIFRMKRYERPREFLNLAGLITGPAKKVGNLRKSSLHSPAASMQSRWLAVRLH